MLHHNILTIYGMSSDTEILFSGRYNDYGFLSNSYLSEMIIDKLEYYHVEGYFQSVKLKDIDDIASERIRQIENPMECERVAKNVLLTKEQTDHWNSIRYNIMKKGVYTKFTSSKYLQKLLIQTGNKNIVNNIEHDSYWGVGYDRKGLNMLGKILMDIRQQLVGANL
jgi:ribA/ribD-fused uncharacterized protein